ncbi:MAG: hypothetical protein K0U41_03560 [Gammaproteobacteria bacterium]|nr:hypothetical protein [Gammaproteobacteria bacterium]
MTKPHKIKMFDFAEYPGGRNIKYGPNSGEKFRREVLLPALRKHDLIEIDIARCYTYAPGFVDEITAHVIRAGFLTHAEYCRRISFVSDKENEFFIKDMFEKFRDEQEPAALILQEQQHKELMDKLVGECDD